MEIIIQFKANIRCSQKTSSYTFDMHVKLSLLSLLITVFCFQKATVKNGVP